MIRLAEESDVGFVSEIVGFDAAEVMDRTITLVTDNGGFFLEKITPSVFEAHMFFRKQGRGREAIDAARSMTRYVFERLGGLVIFGRIPIEDRPARLLTRLIGFTSDGVRAHQPGGPLVEWFELRSDSCPH